LHCTCDQNFLVEDFSLNNPASEAFESRASAEWEIQGMAQIKSARRNLVTRCLAAVALVSIYCVGLIGASTVLLTTGSTAAQARGGGRGGGGRGGGGWGRGRGGGFRGGGGWGRGRGYGFYGPRIVTPGCYYSRRWGRTICPY
jgi:hypothetical protein